MSNRPADQGLPGYTSRSDREARQLPGVSSQEDRNVQQRSASHSVAPSPTIQRFQHTPTRGFGLPPLPQAAISTSGSFSPSALRLAGVSSILNPVQTEETGQGRRRKASELESPRVVAPFLPPLVISNQPSQVSSVRAGTPTATTLGGPIERTQRRILTPRSPSLHHTASLSQLAPSAATISAQHTPFPGSPQGRPYSLEHGTLGAPPLPTPSAAIRPNYGFVGPTPPFESVRRASSGATRGVRLPSASTSPTTSYSSYSQTGHESPAVQYDSLSGHYSSSGEGMFGGVGTASAPPNATGQERQRPMGIPISSSGGQNTYQMMTLETTSGTVQLPVDIQAASRVADEKRRRNAGASARFRQRRKEKEKEASTSIARLEQQIKDVTEAMEFYKRERDYMAAVVLQVPGGDRHFPRPVSPRRQRRPSAGMAGSSGIAGASYSGVPNSTPRSPEQGRNVRRRTSTLSLPAPPQATNAPQGALFQSGYGPQTFGTPIAPQPPPPIQPAHAPLQSPLTRGALSLPSARSPMQQTPALPQLMQAPPQTGPWNPYAPDRRAPPGPPGPPRDAR